MIKVVIVEDEVLVADQLAQILEKNECRAVAMAESMEEAVETLSLSSDLYLLDIRLAHNGNGIQFGHKLKQLGIPFIYITANNEMNVLKKAIETEPITYITKPFNQKDVLAALELAKLKLMNHKSISVIGKYGSEQLLEKDILYCQADGVYTHIFTKDQLLTQRIKLKELEEKLSDQFVRIHRSYIVNTSKITSKKSTAVYLEDQELPVSRSYKKVLAEINE